MASPTNPHQIFDWKLVRTQDTFGNKIEYEYERDAGTAGPHHWDRPYLRRISYAHYGPSDQPLVTVEFEYQPRPDERSYYRSGFEIRNRKRCARITVATHADQTRLARSYELSYRDRPCSLLTQILAIGHDGDAREELPCLELGYQPFDTERRRLIAVGGRQLPTRSLAELSRVVVGPVVFQRILIRRCGSAFGARTSRSTSRT